MRGLPSMGGWVDVAAGRRGGRSGRLERVLSGRMAAHRRAGAGRQRLAPRPVAGGRPCCISFTRECAGTSPSQPANRLKPPGV